jgi:hypothetical protein
MDGGATLMTTRKAFLIAAAVAFLTACSTLHTTTDYDRTADFSKYKTFGFKGVRRIENRILAKRIERALEAQLTSKGLREAETPDVWVLPRVQLGHDTEIYTYNSGWGWRWRGGFGTSVSTVQRIPVGTLVVDLIDAKNKELVWRGVATDKLNPEATPAEREKALDEAVSKLFRSFPPA